MIPASTLASPPTSRCAKRVGSPRRSRRSCATTACASPSCSNASSTVASRGSIASIDARHRWRSRASLSITARRARGARERRCCGGAPSDASRIARAISPRCRIDRLAAQLRRSWRTVERPARAAPRRPTVERQPCRRAARSRARRAHRCPSRSSGRRWHALGRGYAASRRARARVPRHLRRASRRRRTAVATGSRVATHALGEQHRRGSRSRVELRSRRTPSSRVACRTRPARRARCEATSRDRSALDNSVIRSCPAVDHHAGLVSPKSTTATRFGVGSRPRCRASAFKIRRARAADVADARHPDANILEARARALRVHRGSSSAARRTRRLATEIVR